MYSATDIANFLACRHLLSLELAEAAGDIKKPFFQDPFVDLLRELGNRHEKAYLNYLKETHSKVVSIPIDLPWPAAVARTTDAIHDGADVIYQATLQDGHWGGRADFLVRVPDLGSLAGFSYEVVETKLAKSAKVRAILQLCFYSELLGKIQGDQPERMHVLLRGENEPESFLRSRYIAFFRKVKRDFEQASIAPQQTYPEPVSLCDVCDWSPLCTERRRSDDHLSLVAGITRLQRNELVFRNIATVAQLGAVALPLSPKLERVSDASFDRIQNQARVQVQGRNEGRMVYELLPVQEQCGLARLPQPSAGDIFLDFEAADYAFETGIEYLIGIVLMGDQPDYRSLWSFAPAEEKKAFEQFIAIVMERWNRYPGLHIYHYAPYEPASIKRLAGRHGVCTDEVDRLLRAGIFVDLYRVVRQALRASVESYSIKKVELLYGFTRTVSARDSVLALQTFESFLALGGDKDNAEKIVKTVEAYNRDDCLSTLRLRNWLEERRGETERNSGVLLPRPQPLSGEPNENLGEELDRAKALVAALLSGQPEDQVPSTGEEYGQWLLAMLIEWHRREEKSLWWEYFRLGALSDTELLEDKSALGGLTYIAVVGHEKRSSIHRYSFSPQDHTMDRAHEARDPRTGGNPGKIVGIDEQNLTIDLKRAANSLVPHPEALIPYDIVNTDVLRDSLFRLGSWVAANGIDADGPYRAERDLLLRKRPRALTTALESVIDDNGQLTEAAKDLVVHLATEPSVLPIQGPPGSGKTFTGARMIVELVRRGYRVGITANSHKVISLLLGEVCKVARQNAVPMQAVQKSEAGDGCQDPMVKLLNDNQSVHDGLKQGAAQVVAGSAWLWARDQMANSVDVLFIDEAGQMSLANVLAACQAATNSVLLGDPQQLDQPQKGVHPLGADGTAFDHLLQGQDTIMTDQGVFLSETHRLHTNICEFTSELFYEGRLRPRPENDRQRINAHGLINGTGLRFVPVVHSGNQSDSEEEAERIETLVGDLLSTDRTWIDNKGETHKLGVEHILVVAPTTRR
jgi:predicted RecB family nuclease